jgi:hypothetical protein
MSMPEHVNPIERVFEFEDPAFRQYMVMDPINTGELAGVHYRMAGSPNPIVRYAAGWAAVERALVRNRGQAANGLGLTKRVSALDIGMACWSGIADMADYRDSQPTEERKLQVREFEIRMLQAMAYAPAMRIGAACLSGNYLSSDEVQVKWNATQRNAVNIGSIVQQLPVDTPRERQRRAGLASEVLCGMVNMSTPSRRHLATPASLRQDSHRLEVRRADFLLTDMEAPHKRLLQQVTGSNRRLPRSRRLIVRPQEDLLPAGCTSSATVLDIVAKQVAAGVEPWEVSLLTDPARRMEARTLELQRHFP